MSSNVRVLCVSWDPKLIESDTSGRLDPYYTYSNEEAADELKTGSYRVVLLGEFVDEHGAEALLSQLSVVGDNKKILSVLHNKGHLDRHGVSAKVRYVTPEAPPDEVLAEILGSVCVRRTQQRNSNWRSMLIGNSRQMEQVLATIELVARRRCTVLISGETGTGKELAAQAIHMASDRAEEPFVAVNCAALPPDLLEAELFGHTKGAFTGAVNPRVGHFEKAGKGTLFLDEIGELPLELQAKLLRALQEREFFRIGSSTPVKIEARIIAASNVDLEMAVREKRFRSDLYFRLNVVPIRLPALRERRTDIPSLAEHFVERICRAESIPCKALSPRALRALQEYDWPGNVRELEHAVERAVILTPDGKQLDSEDFLVAEWQNPQLALGHVMEIPDGGVDFDALMVQVQKTILYQALQRSGGNKARAASMLGMKRTTLISRVNSLAQCAG